jgi:hypothetical protein
MKAWMKGDRREVYELIIPDQDFIRDCPPGIKTIIAFYSGLYITEENEVLAAALGDFASLKEAQDALLDDKEQFFENIEKQDYIKGSFEIETEDDMVYVNLTAMIGSYSGTDCFRLNIDGEIESLLSDG